MHLKKIHIGVIILSILTNCKSNNSEVKNEVDTTYYPNGKIEQKINTRDYRLKGYSEGFYSHGGIKYRKHFVNDNAFGPFFEFYPSGTLRQFSYLVDNNVYTYSKSYDKKGKLIKEEGNPFVKNYITWSSNNDTLFFDFLFCDFGFSRFSVEISSDAITFKNAILKQNEIDKTKRLKGWKLIRDLDRTSFYIRMIGIDSTNQSKIYNDTLTIQK